MSEVIKEEYGDGPGQYELYFVVKDAVEGDRNAMKQDYNISGINDALFSMKK